MNRTQEVAGSSPASSMALLSQKKRLRKPYGDVWHALGHGARPPSVDHNVVMDLTLPKEWVSPLTDAVAREMGERERWVTLEGLATWLGCSPEHIYDLRQRGLPAHKLTNGDGRLSKKLYFHLREVSEWLSYSSVVV